MNIREMQHTHTHTHTRTSLKKSILSRMHDDPLVLDRRSLTLARLCGTATGGETGKAKSEDDMR